RSVVVDGAGSTWEHSATNAKQLLRVNGSPTSINIKNGGAFSTNTHLAVDSGATFTVNGGTATIAALDSLDNNGLLQLSDAAATSALTISNSDTLADVSFPYGGVISDGPGGPGSITMLGGAEVFSGVTNSYSGGTRLLGGMLTVAGDGSLGTGKIVI